jgi:hypothetical protein
MLSSERRIHIYKTFVTFLFSGTKSGRWMSDLHDCKHIPYLFLVKLNSYFILYMLVNILISMILYDVNQWRKVCSLKYDMRSIMTHVARMGEGRNPCRILVGKPEEKTPLGRPRSR